MITTGMFMLLFNSPFTEAAPFPECDELKRDMKALEIFLQDQDDHESICPKLKWTQPDIEIYKKTLVSQLPEGCIK